MLRRHPRWFTYSDPAAPHISDKASEKDLRKLWKSKQNREWLNQVLSIYKFGFLGELATGFVEKIWKHGFSKIEKSARLIVSQQLNTQETQSHLALRHPIHINGPDYTHIHHTKLQNILGLERKDIEAVQDSVWMRYAILAKTPILQSTHSIDRKTAWILHTWGVNLESRDSTDAQYVFGTGRFSVPRYLAVLTKVFEIIEVGCLYIHETTKNPVVLRVTKLGFGVWLTEMPQRLHASMREKYDQMLLGLAQKHDWLLIRHPLYPSHQTLGCSQSHKVWTLMENNHDPFGKPRDVTDPDYIGTSQDAELVIVNAWDNRSWIGNAGSRDNSLDGWTVASGSNGFYESEFGYPMGSNCVNASYLHNPFFCTELLNEERWVRF